MLQLELGEIETILTSLAYSKKNIGEARDTPYEIRKENLARLDAAEAKVRAIKKALQ